MCHEAGIDGDFSNHSLRASGATELFQSGVPEKVIQDFTGHQSVKALRQYEKVAGIQKRAATNILTGTSHEFTAEVEKIKRQSDVSQQLSPINNTVSTVPEQLIPCNKTAMLPSVSVPVPQPVFSPVINTSGSGTVNFTVNICPSGNISIDTTNESKGDLDPRVYDHLLEGLDVKDFFDEL